MAILSEHEALRHAAMRPRDSLAEAYQRVVLCVESVLSI
jgi:hypothetical protein